MGVKIQTCAHGRVWGKHVCLNSVVARPRSGKTNRRKARAGGKRGGGEKGSARPSPQSIRIGVLLEKSSNIIQ